MRRSNLSEEAKQLVRSFFTDLDSSQSGEAFRKYGAEGYTAHVPGMPVMDRDGMVQFGNAFYQAFPGLHHDVQDIICDGDTVAVRLHISGKHDGTLMLPSGAVPPTGRELSWDAQNIFYLSGGRVVDHWLSMDMATLMQQLGLMG